MKYYRKSNLSDFYHDLRDWSDDKRVLENPNKGWYYHYIDNGVSRSKYRDDIADGYYMEDIPGLNIIYLRVDWADIEKADGIFDWTYIDNIIDNWSKRGYKFTFRFVTYEGPGIRYASPEWVFKDKGAKCREIEWESENIFEPVYDDPIFLKYFERFLAECAKRFDGNPLVEYMDVSGFGTWGEFHTYMGSNITYPFETLKNYVDMSIRNFPNTQLLCNYGVIVEGPQDDIIQKRMIDYCSQMGVGLRCDSINVKMYSEMYGYNSLQTPDLYSFFYDKSPVDLEHEHLSGTSNERFRDGFSYLEALKQAHATYTGFHGAISEWYPKYKHLHDYIANRLGYWYFIDGYALPNEVYSNATAVLTIDVHNSGFSVAYNKYEAKLKLVANNGDSFHVTCSGCDNTHWMPNERCTENIRLKFDNIPDGEYLVYFGLFDKYNRAVEFAIKQKHITDGYINLGSIKVK